MSAESEFGDAIVRRCVELVDPEILKEVDTISWASNSNAYDGRLLTRHVVYRRCSRFRKWLINFGIIKDLTHIASVEIYHDDGSVRVKGSYQLVLLSKWIYEHKITINTYEKLADPDSMLTIGNVIIESLFGRRMLEWTETSSVVSLFGKLKWTNTSGKS